MQTQNRTDRKPPTDPNTEPGKAGKGRETGPAMEEVRELLVQCLHRHLHTNRALDSLNNVDRPPPLEQERETMDNALRMCNYLLFVFDTVNNFFPGGR